MDDLLRKDADMAEGGEAAIKIDAEKMQRPGLAERLLRKAPAAGAFLVRIAGEDGIDLFPDMGCQRRLPERLAFRADDAIGAVLLELQAVAAVDQVEVTCSERFQDDRHALRGGSPVRLFSGRSIVAGAAASRIGFPRSAQAWPSAFAGRLGRSSRRRWPGEPARGLWPGRRSFCLNVFFRVSQIR